MGEGEDFPRAIGAADHHIGATVQRRRIARRSDLAGKQFHGQRCAAVETPDGTRREFLQRFADRRWRAQRRQRLEPAGRSSEHGERTRPRIGAGGDELRRRRLAGRDGEIEQQDMRLAGRARRAFLSPRRRGREPVVGRRIERTRREGARRAIDNARHQKIARAGARVERNHVARLDQNRIGGQVELEGFARAPDVAKPDVGHLLGQRTIDDDRRFGFRPSP